MAIADTFSNLGTAIINYVNRKTGPATTSKLGQVKPDGTTITVDANGVISSAAEGGSGLDMFDVVQKDHILTYEDTEGLAPLGSYVYKEAVVGERYGYPDFYNTCVAEYNDSKNTIETEYIKSNVTHYGEVIDDSGILTNFSASSYVRANTTFSPGANAWEFKTRLYINSVSTTQYIINTGSGAAPTYRELFGIESSKFAVWISSNGSSWNIASSSKGTYTPVAGTAVYVKFGWTGSIYYVDYSLDDITYTRDISISNTTAVYSKNEYPNFGYGWENSPSLSAIDLKETSITVNNSVTWKGADVLTYKHNVNGHSFYDIAHKAFVDEDYEEHEYAWFYGIDTTNKRVFLPRRAHGELIKTWKDETEWYRIYQDGWCEQGGCTEHSNDAKLKFQIKLKDTNYSIIATPGGTPSNASNDTNWLAYPTTRSVDGCVIHMYDSDSVSARTGPIEWRVCGYADEIVSTIFYDYMCVGNKKQNTAWINLVEEVNDSVAEINTVKNNGVSEINATKNNIINEIGGVTHFVARSIGEIVKSLTPLNEAGLHLLDGSVIANGSYAQFVSHMASLYASNPSLFVTESEWQATISTYGVCGKFVYDSAKKTVRLPKVTGIIEGTTDLNALGSLVEAGLPNITGSLSIGDGAYFSDKPDGCFASFSGTSSEDPNVGGSGRSTANFNASLSNPIYGNSNTVQPQTIKALYYIVIAQSAKTELQVDIDNIATDLNNKVSKSDLLEVQCVVETYVNGASGYRIWSDGYCEQWGRGALNECTTTTITLLKAYKDTNYSVSAVSITASTGGDTEAGLQCTPISATQITLTAHYINPNSQTACWETKGYIV